MKNALPHNKAEQSDLDSLKFTAPISEGPRLLLKALVINDSGVSRMDVDYLADVANGPAAIAKLRALGLGKKHLICIVSTRMDHFNRLKRFGLYFLSPLGKQAVRKALGMEE